LTNKTQNANAKQREINLQIHTFGSILKNFNRFKKT